MVVRVLARTVSRLVSRGLSGRLNRSFAQRTQMRSRAASTLRIATLGALGNSLDELVEEAAELLEEASEVIESAFYEAMDLMYGMCGNAGQETVFFDQVIDVFANGVSDTEIGESWSDVDIGEYMVFMGEIIFEGNQIMSAAYDEAAQLADEAEDLEVEIEQLE